MSACQHIWLCSILVTSAYAQLQCHGDAVFRIVQFTDTHLGESNIGDYLTLSMMNSILDKEQPSLVILSGDIISGYAWNGKSGWFAKLWDRVVQPMVARNIPWAFTAGNHDREGEWNAKQIYEYDMRKYGAFGSLTRVGFMDDEHDQNMYTVSVDDSLNNHSLFSIYLMDAGHLDCDGAWNYFGCSRATQLEWFLQQNHSVPGIVYMHIPSQQLMTSFESGQYPVVGHWNRSHAVHCFDERELNHSFMHTIANTPNIVAMFHGHEHAHDAVLLYDHDVLIGFGRKSGESWMIQVDSGEHSKVSGARIFEVADCNDPKYWRTWIRDKKWVVTQNTSFQDMKRQTAIPKSEKASQDFARQCQPAHRWSDWKQTVQQQFQHWITPYVIDVVDVFCRLQIPHWVNDYVYDFGMNSLGPNDNEHRGHVQKHNDL